MGHRTTRRTQELSNRSVAPYNIIKRETQMKEVLYKYFVGLVLFVGLLLVVSPVQASGHSCHVKKDKCSSLMCVAKNCDIVCKAHCKHD